ncbi:hypothetical protein E4T66_06110 [Sinimarinibacterium sp. CAU 1509]|uniref:hypothetical protein n=1 Tax=Sinimarinibacterium sp. CAU 1509 TaxID=2562283 RepID=UPI0010ACD7A1|nr:hypothetical protein [Sinimarinibacterium sp. CAU 1509]TJY63270.1 hypothetical protein E4T66_06110 [Sinimarinibacterium sp. CAU 1509]
MGMLTERLVTDDGGLWLDFRAYAARLLAAGSVPWLDADAATGWMRKAQALLKSNVVSLPVAEVAEAWLRANAGLVAAMGAKRRTDYPLKTLLADEALRAHLQSLATFLRSSFGSQPLVLALPSPRHWVAVAHAQARPGDAVEVDADAVDDAAVYIADFLRSFADCGLDGVLLEEGREPAPSLAEALPLYQPVFNVASHYRWDTGLLLPANVSAEVGEGLDFLVASAPVTGVTPGLRVPESFWEDGVVAPCPERGFRFAEIPVGAHPESVLDRLAGLRGT